MLTWNIRCGWDVTVHAGQFLDGGDNSTLQEGQFVQSHREQQMRRRTYYIRRGQGTGRADVKSRFYVKHTDNGPLGNRMWESTLAHRVSFKTLHDAKSYCWQHLQTHVPKLRMVFVGRSQQPGAEPSLVWKEAGADGMIVQYFSVQADEFYERMTA